jgi:predicted HTH transcriptional regulator
MNDIELIETVALNTERMADEMGNWNNETLDFNFEEILTDTSLLLAFAMWRELFGKCHYCSQKAETIEWHTSDWWKNFDRSLPHRSVCLTNLSCWQKALDEGFIVISEGRRPYVEALFKQGKTRRQMQEILRVSQATIDKDIRILKAKGKIS